MLVKKGERMPIGIYSLAGRMGRGHLPGRRDAGARGTRLPWVACAVGADDTDGAAWGCARPHHSPGCVSCPIKGEELRWLPG